MSFPHASGTPTAKGEHLAKAGVTYDVRGQCQGTTPGDSVNYRVTPQDDTAHPLTEGRIRCGANDINEITAFTPQYDTFAIELSLTGSLDGITQAFVVVVPNPVQTGQQGGADG